jgi:thiamine monophosphate synthase
MTVLPPRLPFALLALADAPLWRHHDATTGATFAFAAARLARHAHQAGVPVAVWLRAHGLSVADWQSWLQRLGFLPDLGLPLIVTAPWLGRPLDAVAVAQLAPLLRQAGVLGLQVPESQRQFWSAWRLTDTPSGFAVGFSCHDRAGLAAAQIATANWATLSPVLPTASKPAAVPLGLDQLRSLVATTTVPVVALGGLDASHVGPALRAGAAAVAVGRAVWADPGAIVAAIAQEGGQGS